MMDVHDVVSDYYIKLLRNLTNTSPELSRSRALTMLSGIYLVDLHILLCHSSLLVRIAVFDFRAYDVQLKTKLYLRGRVNNNACEQIIMPQRPVKPDKQRTRALTICSGSIWSISPFEFPTALSTFPSTGFSSCLQACSRT
jgi:hypothetical protein